MDVTGHYNKIVGSAYRRFGWCLVGSVAVLVSVAAAVSVRPRSNLEPPFGTTISTASIADNGRNVTQADARIRAVLDAFVGGLERNDDERMRSVYPNLTRRDARILHSVRKRLGPEAHLSIATLRLVEQKPTSLTLDFVILSESGSNRPLRLPFTAKMEKTGGDWQIAQLR